MVKYDLKKFDESMRISEGILKRFIHGLEKDLPTVLKKNGVILADKLLEITPPYGKQSITEKAIESDIRNMFKPLRGIPFKDLVLSKQWDAVRAYDYKMNNPRYDKWIADENWNQIYRLFSKHGDVPNPSVPTNIVAVKNATKDLHASGRGGSGGQNWRWDKKTVYYVSNYTNSVNALVRDAKQKINSMAGGWAKVINRLGGVSSKASPAITSKGSGGIMFSNSAGREVKLTIWNDLGNFNGYLTSQKSAQVKEIMNEISGLTTRDIIGLFKKHGKDMNPKS